MLPEIHKHWRTVVDTVDQLPGPIGSIAYQPFPRSIAQIAKEKGGDLMGFDDGADHIVIELNLSFWNKKDYETGANGMRKIFDGVREKVVSWQEVGDIPNVHLPLFSNDAFFEQDYYGRMLALNADLVKSLVEELDPNGLFQTRTGGWKP